MSPTPLAHRRASIIRHAGGCILRVAEQRLPSKLYQLALEALFAAYRRALRYYFLRHSLAALLTGDVASREMAWIIFSIMPCSLVGESGLIQTYRLATRVEKSGLQGAFVEMGVARGGCGALMAEVARRYGGGRPVWLFDSFEGLPEPSEKDFSGTDRRTGEHIRPLDRGSCLGTYDEVRRLLFEERGFDPSEVIMVKGWFEETLPVSAQRIGPIALLRIDVDWYESTKCCLEHLFDRVVPGGFIVIDDYGTCYGCRRAVDEFFEARRIEAALTFDKRGGCWFQKPAPGAKEAGLVSREL